MVQGTSSSPRFSQAGIVLFYYPFKLPLALRWACLVLTLPLPPSSLQLTSSKVLHQGKPKLAVLFDCPIIANLIPRHNPSILNALILGSLMPKFEDP